MKGVESLQISSTGPIKPLIKSILDDIIKEVILAVKIDGKSAASQRHVKLALRIKGLSP
jgi:hypothetical protein